MIDWRVADRELRRIARTRSGLDLDEARWLIVGRNVQVHREAGYATFFEYLERVLAYDPHTARERLRVADALVGLPLVREKLASGELAYSAVRELTRVVRPDTEAAWVAIAIGKTVREIEKMTAGRKPGDRPDTPAQPDLRPRHLRLELATETYALFREARRALENERGEHLSDDDVIRAMAQAVLRPGGAEGKKPAYQIQLTACPTCERATQDGAGLVVDIAPAVIDKARCDAEVIATTGERTAIPLKTRQEVFRREHGRCAVPGCRSARHLAIHHLDHDPSNHALDNLVLLCDGHHTLHHDRKLRIDRRDGALVFAHADGRPYGTPPPSASDDLPLIARTLEKMGFDRRSSRAAVERAVSHVGRDAPLEQLVRAALREAR